MIVSWELVRQVLLHKKLTTAKHLNGSPRNDSNDSGVETSPRGYGTANLLDALNYQRAQLQVPVACASQGATDCRSSQDDSQWETGNPKRASSQPTGVGLRCGQSTNIAVHLRLGKGDARFKGKRKTKKPGPEDHRQNPESRKQCQTNGKQPQNEH